MLKLGNRKSLALEIAEIVVLALGIYLVITFAIQTVHVIGDSMVPTLGNDDYLVASKLDYRLHSPQRGDIVILHNPYGAKNLIKRVVGLPGERVLIRQGRVYINGHRLLEPYVATEPWTVNANWPRPDGGGEGTVMPAGDYFVLGDNRNHSNDSRIFGPVARASIEARAWLRVWPPTRMGVVDGRPSLASIAGSAWPGAPLAGIAAAFAAVLPAAARSWSGA